VISEPPTGTVKILFNPLENGRQPPGESKRPVSFEIETSCHAHQQNDLIALDVPEIEG